MVKFQIRQVGRFDLSLNSFVGTGTISPVRIIAIGFTDLEAPVNVIRIVSVTLTHPIDVNIPIQQLMEWCIREHIQRNKKAGI